MAELLDVNPTRGNLLRLREDLERLRGHHDLLDRKRRELVREVMQRLDAGRAAEREAREAFGEARRRLRTARMRMGGDRVRQVALSPVARARVSLEFRTLMGVAVPDLEVEVEPVDPPYAMPETSPALDAAREAWMAALRSLGRAGRERAAIRRMGAELGKTRRQVNALESVLIPRHRDTIRAIETRLEERERDEIVQARKVKESKGR